MDTQGKPSYSADDCPTCASWREQRAGRSGPVCDGCGKAIAPLENVPAGYDAHTIDHWHFTQVGGKQALRPVKMRLCPPCYRKDWKKTYPKTKCPV